MVWGGLFLIILKPYRHPPAVTDPCTAMLAIGSEFIHDTD